jgi:hypothetical protein
LDLRAYSMTVKEVSTSNINTEASKNRLCNESAHAEKMMLFAPGWCIGCKVNA